MTTPGCVRVLVCELSECQSQGFKIDVRVCVSVIYAQAYLVCKLRCRLVLFCLACTLLHVRSVLHSLLSSSPSAQKLLYNYWATTRSSLLWYFCCIVIAPRALSFVGKNDYLRVCFVHNRLACANLSHIRTHARTRTHTSGQPN